VAFIERDNMRKIRQLTDKEKKEIDVYRFRRKELYITMPLISLLSGYSLSHLCEVESYRYRMTDSLKKTYDRVIKYIEKEAKKYRKPTKRADM
jgi:hypothetical protein